MNKYRATVITNRMEQNSCRGKREYLSMREASDGAMVVSKRIGESLVAYQCPFCCLFHVGHRSIRKRLEAERKLKRYGFNTGGCRGSGQDTYLISKPCGGPQIRDEETGGAFRTVHGEVDVP